VSETGAHGPADEPVDATPEALEAPAPASAETPAAQTAPGETLPAEGAPGETAPGEAVAEPEEQPVKGPRGRVVNFRVRLPRTRRGLFALLLVVGAFAFAGIWTSVTLVHWTETADFCGRCHQMGPELAGYVAGPHNDVTCGECHVEPGVAGWVKAKLNGTRQLIQVLTGTYPKPIPPPDHGDLPAVQDTCLKCHSLGRLATSTVYTRTSFGQDEPNSRSFIGLMIRPNGGNTFDVNRSVHWHVIQDVHLWSPTENTSTIDLVEVTRPNGTVEEYISGGKVTVSSDVQPDIDTIKSTQKDRKMDCIQCHNRIGHPIPNPRSGLDKDLTSGLIADTLPYIKREGMRILSASYPDAAAADAEAEKLAGFYELNYPQVAKQDATKIDQAITQIQLLYRLTAMPEMKVTYQSYPNFMGHKDFPGCFRCHDGGHFLVSNGAVTKTVIPYTCDTCHTFPQLGSDVATLPLGEPPATHNQALWVFNHKTVATSVDPGGQSCGQCHARDYCEGCHATGAININHDEMATNHAQVIRNHGNASCAYCHQPVFCAQCHTDKVLPASPSVSGEPTSAPAGMRWPLVARGPAATGRTPP
jgi:nitrate/TMAO reductase-like tetraheme cytochrome c subunit